MVMLRGFLVLSAFFVAGEALRLLLALPISGGVLGMVLLIMPGVVGVFFLGDAFDGQWLAVGVALVAGTLLSVLTTLWLMQRFTNDPQEAKHRD